jgi:hypothetical protein
MPAEAAERPSRCYAVCTPSESEGFAVLTVYTVRSTGTTVRRAELEIATDPRLGLLRSSGEEAYGVEVDMMPRYPPTGQTGTANVTKAKQGAGRPRKGRARREQPLCTKCGRSQPVRGGAIGRCLKCGGGKRCKTPNCLNSAASGGVPGLCLKCGGGERCKTPNCLNRAAIGGVPGLCVKCGGGKRCKTPNCENSAVSGGTGLCIGCGGGERCKTA